MAGKIELHDPAHPTFKARKAEKAAADKAAAELAEKKLAAEKAAADKNK